MPEPILSQLAKQDLAGIETYISIELNNPIAAQRIVTLITERIRSLADYPFLGPVLFSYVNDAIEYRRLVCGKYCVFYRLEDQTAVVIRILHGLQDYEGRLFGSVN